MPRVEGFQNVHLLRAVLERCIIGLGSPERFHPFITNVVKSFRRYEKRDALFLDAGIGQLLRRVLARHDRIVRYLVATLREEQRQRRLAGAREAKQNQVGLRPEFRLGAVVSPLRVVDGIDHLQEWFRDPARLRAHLRSPLGIQQALQLHEHGLPQIHCSKGLLPGTWLLLDLLLHDLSHLRAHQGVHHQSSFRAGPAADLRDLLGVADMREGLQLIAMHTLVADVELLQRQFHGV
mmetsp:Transcript_78860/g.225923  ORF Transcript_78860/g.225923 Transcript_78860/m.225923 type:complete len:236 (+) Transcript_78860:209-916(+)